MAKADEDVSQPAFEGKPLRQVPIPAVYLWHDDEFGSALLSEYQDMVRLEYDNNPALRIFKVAAGIVHGSNPFAVCLVDMIARPEVRVATPVDMQAILDSQRKSPDPLRLRGTYKDTALVLRSIKEPNSYLAQKINEQVGLKNPLPALLFLSGLELVKDPLSLFDLSFKFTQNTRFFHAPILQEKSGRFRDADVDRNTGLPTRLGESGPRYFYSMDEGLTRLYLGRGGALDTIWDELGNSQVDGRVIMVDNTVPPETLPEYLSRLDAVTDLIGS